MLSPFERVIDVDLALGEGPVWDEDRQALWFVDIVAPALYRLDWPSRALARHAMPSDIGSLGLADRGRLVVALRSGIHLFDPQDESLTFLVHPEPELTTVNRMNDGKVGPDGSFWVGSLHDASPRKPTGALYRITPQGGCARVVEGVHVSNGLAWTADGRTMTHADSTPGSITAYDFDAATGAVSNARRLATLSEAEGRPDGAAFDTDGHLWSAGVSAGCLNRIAPSGAIERFDVPAPAPTMPCFGGPDGRTLFVTSLAKDTPQGRVGGTLLACTAAVTGVPVGRFGSPAHR
jgi:sugar lactone lactonase YvrE